MILKAVAILFVFAFVVYVLKMISRLTANVRKTAKELNKMRDQAPTRQPQSTEMVRCASCGAFVAPRDAVQVTSSRRAQRFCSYECVQAHAKTA